MVRRALKHNKMASLTVNSSPHPFQTYPLSRQLEERNMQFKREKVGAPPQGGGGSYPTPTPRPPKKSIRIEGLPEGHNKVATYAHGGGKPIKVNSGSFNGWLVGGGKRSEVRGKT